MMARDRENTNGLYMNHVFFPYQSGVAIVAGFFSTIFKHPQVLSGMMICEVHQKKVEMVETAKQLWFGQEYPLALTGSKLQVEQKPLFHM